MKHRSKHNDLIDYQMDLLSRPLPSRVIVLMMLSMMQHNHTQRPRDGPQDPGPGCGSLQPCRPGVGPQPQDPGQRGAGSAAQGARQLKRAHARARAREKGGEGVRRAAEVLYIYMDCAFRN